MQAFIMNMLVSGLYFIIILLLKKYNNEHDIGIIACQLTHVDKQFMDKWYLCPMK